MISVGPLTNIAMLYKMFPETREKIKEVFIMGGNFQGRGNVTKSAEFNFWFDPEAANIVLKETKQPMYIFPWETSLKTGYNFGLEEFGFNYLGSNKNKFSVLLNKVEKKMIHPRFDFFKPCDAFTVFCFMFKKAIIEMERQHMTVELNGKHTRGQCVVDHRRASADNVNLIIGIDTNLFKDYISWVCGHVDFDFKAHC